MKKMFLGMLVCLGVMLFTAPDDITCGSDYECCCQMTCNYVRVLGGSPTTIDVDQCWDMSQVLSCSEDWACLRVKSAFITYTNEWSGSGCHSQEKCFLSFLYAPDNPSLDVLRAFRDEVLSQTADGRQLIDLYYGWSPVLIEAMEEDDSFREYLKEMVELYFPMMRGGK